MSITFGKFARVLKLAVLCFSATFIVTACFDGDNTPISSNTTQPLNNTEKITVFIGCSVGHNYEVFVNNASIGTLDRGIAMSTMKDWIDNGNKNPYSDSSCIVPPYLIYQVTPGTITISTKNTWDKENFNQEFVVNKDATCIYLDYESIKLPSDVDYGHPKDSL